MNIQKTVNGLAGTMRRLLRQRRGTAAIEFAFIAPIFLLMLIGTLEIGYMIFGNALMDYALSNYARAASLGERIGPTDTVTSPYSSQNIKDYIVQKTAGVIDPCDPNFSLSVTVNGVQDGTLGGPKALVQYSLQYDWPLLTGYLENLGIFDHIIHFSTATLVRNEDFPVSLLPTRTASYLCGA